MGQTSLPLRHAPATWHGVLSGLIGVLTAEVARQPMGTWSHRLLPHGALVSMKMTPDKRRVLRIAREKRPQTPQAWRAWATEVETFLKHFHTEHWQPQVSETATGVAARFLELHQGEGSPGKARCPECQSEIPYDLVWGRARGCAACGARTTDPSAGGQS
jgi:hypothetical protein